MFNSKSRTNHATPVLFLHNQLSLDKIVLFYAIYIIKRVLFGLFRLPIAINSSTIKKNISILDIMSKKLNKIVKSCVFF